ncbi:MAG: RNA methyltransferase [Acidobacteriota bacterium]|nr:RNA methyltransferase [Acidobacteriota bacterium]
MPAEITSRQNAVIKACRALARGRDGDAVLLDGAHLLEDALDAELAIQAVVASHAFAEAHHRLIAALEARALVYLASDEVLEGASPVRTPGGVIAIATLPEASVAHALPQHAAEGSPYLPAMAIALVDVQDPGNAGAVVRSVEAAGGTGVVACGATADLRGWKALRASMGSSFRVPLAASSVDHLFDDAKVAGVRVIASTLDQGSVDMRDIGWIEPFVLLVGNEGNGLASDIARRAEVRVRIPMFGKLQSMNAAMSAAVILYEAQRQRAHPGEHGRTARARQGAD